MVKCRGVHANRLQTERLLFPLEYWCCIKTLHHRQQFVLLKLLLNTQYHSPGGIHIHWNIELLVYTKWTLACNLISTDSTLTKCKWNHQRYKWQCMLDYLMSISCWDHHTCKIQRWKTEIDTFIEKKIDVANGIVVNEGFCK